MKKIGVKLMDLRISKEHVLKVAEKFGYDIELDSKHPGFIYINEDGEKVCVPINAVIKEVCGEKNSMKIEIEKKEVSPHGYKVKNKFDSTMLVQVA